MAPPAVRTLQHTCANVSLGTRELHAIKVGTYLPIYWNHTDNSIHWGGITDTLSLGNADSELLPNNIQDLTCRPYMPLYRTPTVSLDFLVVFSRSHSYHPMSKPSDRPLINDLQQCIILPNVFCKCRGYLRVSSVTDVMLISVLL